MFTGIIQEVAPLSFIKKLKKGQMIAIQKPKSWKKLIKGESIAVSGICLSLLKAEKNNLIFEQSPETLRLAKVGKIVNLERSLRMGDFIGGHLVSGHVDGIVELKKIIKRGTFQSWIFKFDNKKFHRLLVKKGSIAIDGISLTISKILPKKRFQVDLIPITLAKTNLKNYKEGDFLNFETDQLVKHMIKLGRKN